MQYFPSLFTVASFHTNSGLPQRAWLLGRPRFCRPYSLPHRAAGSGGHPCYHRHSCAYLHTNRQGGHRQHPRRIARTAKGSHAGAGINDVAAGDHTDVSDLGIGKRAKTSTINSNKYLLFRRDPQQGQIRLVHQLPPPLQGPRRAGVRDVSFGWRFFGTRTPSRCHRRTTG